MMLLAKKIIQPLVFLIVLGVAASSAFAVGESTESVTKADSTEVQKALAEAGFYKGSIDGVVGTKTKEAIKKFQEANGLKVDGVCGPKTWEKLKAYLEEAAEIDATTAAATTAEAAAAETVATVDEEVTATTPTLDEEEVSSDYGYSEYDSTDTAAADDELKQKLVS